jgi:alcohol dehydrogenase
MYDSPSHHAAQDGLFVTWLGPREAALQRRPRPAAGSDEVVVRVAAAGLCGSDINAFEGRSKVRIPPLVLGHELAGTIVSDGVAGDTLFAVNPLSTCGGCAACRSGRTNLCADRRLLGLHCDGGLSTYAVVRRDRLWPVPGLRPIQASLIEPLAAAVHVVRLAMRDPRAWPPRTTAVIGAGGQGLMTLQVLRAFGARSVTVYEPDADRREIALRLGAASAAAPPAPESPAPDVRAGLVVDAVGASATRHLGQSLVAAGGTIVWLGLHEPDAGLDALDIVAREIDIRGSYAYTDADFDSAVRLATESVVDLESWVTIMPIESAIDVLAGERRPAKAVFTP